MDEGNPVSLTVTNTGSKALELVDVDGDGTSRSTTRTLCTWLSLVYIHVTVFLLLVVGVEEMGSCTRHATRPCLAVAGTHMCSTHDWWCVVY